MKRYDAKIFRRTLRNAREDNGIDSAQAFIEKTKIPQATFYDHVREGGLTMRELFVIFDIANFSNEQILKVFGREK